MTDRDRDYEALRAALADLRAAHEREAPSFDAVLARRPSRSSFARPRLTRLAIAAGLVLAAGITYRVVAGRGERLTVPREVVALSAWRPASDMLLETPLTNLLRESPRLGASLITTRITGEFR